MWLIDTKSLLLTEFLGPEYPDYAILSHTWEQEEVVFNEMISGTTPEARAKKGYTKIERTCQIAAGRPGRTFDMRGSILVASIRLAVQS